MNNKIRVAQKQTNIINNNETKAANEQHHEIKGSTDDCDSRYRCVAELGWAKCLCKTLK